MKQPRILVVGSSNTDLTVAVPRIPRPGETILGGEFTTAAGGKGANQAVAAARCGGNVTFIARVGRDVFGQQAIAGFRQDRINTRFIVRDSARPTGVALIFVASDGQNSIGVASGANSFLSEVDVRRAEPAFAHADLLLAQLETPLTTVVAAVELAAKHRLPIILNPAPARELPDALLRKVSILTPNENEAELLTGIKVTNDRTAAQAAKKLHRRGARTVIITLGPRGAFVSDFAGGRRLPGFRVRAVDTTAAGDIFNGALAVAVAKGQGMAAAVQFAAAAAALSVTRTGAQPSAPRRIEIVRFAALSENWSTADGSG
jgi:ribokinase